MRLIHCLLVPLLSSSISSALTIDLRYDLDASGFFNQPGAKEAMQKAADFYGRMISDHLGAIDSTKFPAASWAPTYADPVTGLTTKVPGKTNLLVPADTIIVFLGAADLGTLTGRGGPGGITAVSAEAAGSGFPWANQVYNRGEAGAIRLVMSGSQQAFTTDPVDFAPWGGTVFLNSTLADWNFSTTDPAATTGPDALSVALHELGHVLGIGAFVVQNSWTTLSKTGAFKGPLAAKSFGSQVATDGAHLFPFGVNSRIYGAFGRTHGASEIPLMVSNLPSASRFFLPTDLELSVLQDMGWEIDPPPPTVTVSVGASPQLRIASTTGFNYQIGRSEDLAAWSDTLPLPLAGNGSRLTWIDPASANSAFYRVTRTAAPVVATAASAGGRIFVRSEDSGLVSPPDLPPCNCE